MTNATDKPWEHEPDHVMFMSEAGYVCEIKRHEAHKHLCGYIYIPFGHPDYGKSYNELYGLLWDDAPDVHGGWTFSHDGGDDDGGKYTKFGFDCAHAGDLSPGLYERMPKGWSDAETYKDIAFVTEQLENAAKQFKERSKQ